MSTGLAAAGAGGGGLMGLLGGPLGGILMSLAPGLLNHLFGGDPQKDYRNRANAILAPGNMGKLTNDYFQQNVGGPGYAQGQQQIAAGANQTQNNLMQNLGARGLGTSGTGAILSSLMPSLVGGQMAQQRTGAWNQAQGQAQNTANQQLQALGGSMAPSQTSQMFGGGLAALGPLLEQWMKMQGGAGAARNGLTNLMSGMPTPGMYQSPLPQPINPALRGG